MARLTKGRRNSNERGNSYARRARKQFLLDRDGNGVVAQCWECSTLVTAATMIVDRIKPGEDGGTYVRTNIRVHCGWCSCRQGQRRTTELRRENKCLTT